MTVRLNFGRALGGGSHHGASLIFVVFGRTVCMPRSRNFMQAGSCRDLSKKTSRCKRSRFSYNIFLTGIRSKAVFPVHCGQLATHACSAKPAVARPLVQHVIRATFASSLQTSEFSTRPSCASPCITERRTAELQLSLLISIKEAEVLLLHSNKHRLRPATFKNHSQHDLARHLRYQVAKLRSY